jgi:hypothetical protein
MNRSLVDFPPLPTNGGIHMYNRLKKIPQSATQSRPLLYTPDIRPLLPDPEIRKTLLPTPKIRIQSPLPSLLRKTLLPTPQIRRPSPPPSLWRESKFTQIPRSRTYFPGPILHTHWSTPQIENRPRAPPNNKWIDSQKRPRQYLQTQTQNSQFHILQKIINTLVEIQRLKQHERNWHRTPKTVEKMFEKDFRNIKPPRWHGEFQKNLSTVQQNLFTQINECTRQHLKKGIEQLETELLMMNRPHEIEKEKNLIIQQSLEKAKILIKRANLPQISNELHDYIQTIGCGNQTHNLQTKATTTTTHTIKPQTNTEIVNTLQGTRTESIRIDEHEQPTSTIYFLDTRNRFESLMETQETEEPEEELGGEFYNTPLLRDVEGQATGTEDQQEQEQNKQQQTLDTQSELTELEILAFLADDLEQSQQSIHLQEQEQEQLPLQQHIQNSPDSSYGKDSNKIKNKQRKQIQKLEQAQKQLLETKSFQSQEQISQLGNLQQKEPKLILQRLSFYKDSNIKKNSNTEETQTGRQTEIQTQMGNQNERDVIKTFTHKGQYKTRITFTSRRDTQILIIGDSNLQRAHEHAIPDDWEIHSIPGTTLQHIKKILENTTIHENIKHIILAAGINDRKNLTKHQIDQLAETKNFIENKNITTHFLGVSYSATLPLRQQENLTYLNNEALVLFGETYIQPLRPTQTLTIADNIHHEFETTQRILSSIRKHLNFLSIYKVDQRKLPRTQRIKTRPV